jgi:Predicted ATP-dependent Lon-type protease
VASVSELYNKVVKYFGDYAVDKRLAYELELSKIPRYVAEYLIAEFKGEGGDWQGKLRRFIQENFYEPEAKELVKHKLVTQGTVRLVDELTVFVDIVSETHVGVIQSLDLWAEVPVDIVEKNKASLVTGMWGLITLSLSVEKKEVFGRPINAVVVDFKPFQSPEIDPRLLEETRQYFTLDEWIEVLIKHCWS